MVTLATRVLQEAGRISLPPQPHFDAIEIFAAVDMRDIKIGNHFREWFSGKKEAAIGTTTLRYSELTVKSPDSVIMAELATSAETFLAQLTALIANQLPGKKGVLLADPEQINVFYIKDTEGIRRMVYVGRGRKRWGIGVSLADDLYLDRYTLTPPGVRIFSQV